MNTHRRRRHHHHNSHDPMIVFCTTCKGRAQHIKETLNVNILDNQDYQNCKFVVLDYGSDDDLLEYLSHYPTFIDKGRLSVYSLLNAGSFQMAHAKNVAHRLGILE